MMNVRPPREPLEFAKHRQNVLTTEEPPVEIVPQALEFAAFTRKSRFLAHGAIFRFHFFNHLPFFCLKIGHFEHFFKSKDLSLKSSLIIKSKSEIKCNSEIKSQV